MSMNTYPLQETLAFYLDETCAPYIALMYDKKNDNAIPESVQALIDTNNFDRAVYETLSLEEFKRQNPGYDHLTELLPEDYTDISVAADLLYEEGIECVFCAEANCKISTYEKDGFDIMLHDELLLYLPPSRTPSYFTKAYDSIEEVIEEYKEKTKEFLPIDFDYRKHICSISGTYFC